jgi:hypothetical protein
LPPFDKLQDCYYQLQKILGQDTEPYESVALVEQYRKYWKPDNVRIILLAESHVFTTEGDRSIPLPNIANLPEYPTEYAKFVYCLAYGEKNLTGNKQHPKRDGTPQFWKIFLSCNNRIKDKYDFNPILSRTRYEQRLKNKIDLLLSLKQKGIWLVDSSIVALYKNGEKPPHKKMLSVIRRSWECYIADVIREANPEHVICIGKGVARVLENDIKKLVGNRYTVIAQPNAHLSPEEHMENFKQYTKVCIGN